MEPLPITFDMLQYFETICLQWKNFDRLNNMRHVKKGGGAAGGL